MLIRFDDPKTVNDTSMVLSTAFSAQDCNKIGMVAVEIQASPVITTIAKYSTKTVPLTDNTQWIYDRICKIFMQANDVTFQYDLTGIAEELQIYEYGETDYQELTHSMCQMDGQPVRKLKLVVPLFAETNTFGGVYETLYSADNNISWDEEIGSAIVTPSFIMTKVTPVVKGKVGFLVSYATGPRFL